MYKKKHVPDTTILTALEIYRNKYNAIHSQVINTCEHVNADVITEQSKYELQLQVFLHGV